MIFIIIGLIPRLLKSTETRLQIFVISIEFLTKGLSV